MLYDTMPCSLLKANRRLIPEERSLQNYRCGKLKSYTAFPCEMATHRCVQWFEKSRIKKDKLLCVLPCLLRCKDQIIITGLHLLLYNPADSQATFFAFCLPHARFLPSLFFTPTDGGDMFIWNVSLLSVTPRRYISDYESWAGRSVGERWMSCLKYCYMSA